MSEREQIDKLANFIMAEIEGEPSQSQGVVDTTIRLIKQLRTALAAAKKENSRLTSRLDNFVHTNSEFAKRITKAEADLKLCKNALKKIKRESKKGNSWHGATNALGVIAEQALNPKETK